MEKKIMRKHLPGGFRDRYFRKVIAGVGIYHHGDCNVFSSEICTCGLLHDLKMLKEPDKLYEYYYTEKAKHDIKLRETHCPKVSDTRTGR